MKWTPKFISFIRKNCNLKKKKKALLLKWRIKVKNYKRVKTWASCEGHLMERQSSRCHPSADSSKHEGSAITLPLLFPLPLLSSSAQSEESILDPLSPSLLWLILTHSSRRTWDQHHLTVSEEFHSWQQSSRDTFVEGYLCALTISGHKMNLKKESSKHWHHRNDLP